MDEEDISNVNVNDNYAAEESTIAFPTSPVLKERKRKRKRKIGNVSVPGSHSDSTSGVGSRVSQISDIKGSSTSSANNHGIHDDKKDKTTPQKRIVATSKATQNEVLPTVDMNAPSALTRNQDKTLISETDFSNTDTTPKVDCQEGTQELEKSPVLKSSNRKISRRSKKKILFNKDANSGCDKTSVLPGSSRIDSQHRENSCGSNLLPNDYSDLSFSVLEEICQTTELSFNRDTAAHKTINHNDKQSSSALSEKRSTELENKNVLCDKLVNSNVIDEGNNCDNKSKIEIVDIRKEGKNKFGSIYINNSRMPKKPVVNPCSIKTLLQPTKLLEDAESVSSIEETRKQKEFKLICRKEKLNDGSYVCFDSISKGNRKIGNQSRNGGRYNNKVSCDKTSLMEKYNIDMNNTLNISSEQLDDMISNAEKSNSHITTGKTTPSVPMNSEFLNIFDERQIVPIDTNSISETFVEHSECESKKTSFEPSNNFNRITKFQEPNPKSLSLKKPTKNATLPLKLSCTRTNDGNCARNNKKMLPEIVAKNVETRDVKLFQKSNPVIDREKLICDKVISTIRETNCDVLDGSPTIATESNSTSGKSNPELETVGTTSKGFSTASGKSVTVSEKALINARKMLFENENNNTAFSGFSTANGKTICVSEEALSKAKKLLTENECYDAELSSKQEAILECKDVKGKEKVLATKNAAFCGFSTANGQSISISDEALAKARTLFQENESELNELSFSTVNGKHNKVCENSLTEASKFSSINKSCNEVFDSFSTTKGKSNGVLKEALARVKTFVSKKNDSADNKFIGFSTAKGKPIEVSKEALVNARKLLAENEPCDTAISDPSTAKLKSFPVPNEAPAKTRTLLQEKESNDNTFGGFSTAKGKSITVSEEALARAKTFLLENDSVEDKFVGFSTATGKQIKVSEEAVVKARTLLSEKESCETAHIGFSTAKGESIPFSEEALAKARLLFSEKESDLECSGFSTARGKSIKVSEEALTKAKTFLSETDCDAAFSGFSTAKGKSIQVSEEALSKARNLLAENEADTVFSSVRENLVDSAFSGFSTAKGKSIQVSEEALSKARNFLAENEADTGFLSVRENSKLSSEEALVQAKNKSPGLSAINLKTFSPYQISNISKNESFNASDDSKLQNECNKLDTIEEEPSLKGSCVDEHFEPQSSHEKNLKSPNVQSQFYDDMPCLSLSFVDEVSESTAAFLADEDVLECPNTPVWLKTFVTSPSLVQDRSVALSPILCSDSEVKMREKRACSPILGLGDRFKKRKKCLTFSKKKSDDTQEAECSTPASNLSRKTDDPYGNFMGNLKTSTPISINRAKIKRAIQIDESNCASEKRLRLMDSWDDSQVDQTIFYQLDVIEGRRKAAEKQELLLKNGKDKSLTKMQKGALFVKKKLENQIPLRSLVKVPRTALSELIKEGVKQSVIEVTHKNAAEFRFSSSNSLSNEICESNCDGVSVGDDALVILSDDGSAGLKEISRAFLASPGVDPSLISHEWIANHYRLIVWKLASIERSIPHLLAGSYLTLDTVLHQLKYRYDREIDDCQRSCLRKILETDESAARRMVVCVSDIVRKSSGTKEVKLTDGWYGISASLDEEMMCLIERGRVAVGTKLVIQGCELLNCEQGFDPLQVPDTVQLKIHTNSARRVKWDTRLGFCQIQGPILIKKLKDILPKGGSVGRIDVLVVRVYPLVYLFKTESGKTVVYSKKREEQECLLNERKMAELIEKLQSQVQKEMDESDSLKSSSKVGRSFANQYDEPLSTQDLVEYDQIPTKDQMRIMSNLREQKQRKYQETLRQKLDEKMSENGPGKRNSIPMLKVKVIDSRPINEHNNSTLETALLTVWKPTEDVENVLVEGNIVSLYNVTAQGKRSGELQLSTGRQTKYAVGSKSEAFSRVCHHLRDISRSLKPLFSEINTVGIVVHVESSSTSVETAYLTDHENNFLGIRFWGGIKKHGWQSCVCVGSEISCSNLEWRSNVFRISVPHVFVTELSVFSSNPRSKYLQDALHHFKLSLKGMDLNEFLSESKEKLLELLNGGETGGSKLNSSSGMCSSGQSTPSAINKTLITESPMSSVKSKVLLEKMQMLHGYGNPPAITAMPSLQVSPALKKDFKTPCKKSL